MALPPASLNLSTAPGSREARPLCLQAVPDADAVITNPTHYTVAVKYDTDG